MARLTDNTIVTHPETGQPVLLAADGPLPDWAAGLVGDHLLDGPASSTQARGESLEQKRARLLAQLAELDGSAPDGTGGDPASGGEDGDAPPPKGGAGSGAPAWREYAARRGVEVSADASREDVIAALDEAGVRTE
ncbi:hypothetical protein ACFYUR_22050 [Micromonospora haikouensis]|uniref:hypothetical protein n=1 Tax=Micromonospora haikouensis TaxID=686309 RepID=UPI003699AC40